MTRTAVIGPRGMLGSALVEAFRRHHHDVIGMGRELVDLDDPTTARRISEAEPDVVINAAAWTDVDGCARDPERAMRLNGTAVESLADAAEAAGALFVQVSTNEVFDGASADPYDEDAAPNPINPYGASKLAGEVAARRASKRIVVRTAWLFDADRGFPTRIVAAADRLAEQGRPLNVVDDEWGNPTWVPDLADRIVKVAGLPADQRPPILHLAGTPPTSRFSWAQTVLGQHRPNATVRPIPLASYERPSRVPPRAVLATELAESLGLAPIGWQNRGAAGSGGSA